MLAHCPLQFKIKPIEDALNSASEALQVYLLTSFGYPSPEVAIQLRNTYMSEPFFSSPEQYAQALKVYNETTSKGVVLTTDKAEAVLLQNAYRELGFTIQGTADTSIIKVTGSRKIRDRDTFMFVVNQPHYTPNIAFKTAPIAEDKIAFNKTEYQFKAVNIITANLPKITSLFSKLKNTGEFWNKIQKDFQIPKDQIELLKQSKGDTIEEKLASFIADYSYTVQTEVTRGGNKDLNIRETEYNGEKRWIIVDIYTTMPLKSFKTEKEAKTYLLTELQKPTSHYADLTVPGGTNYTENEIKTPDITPSIKGHAEFSTDQGIGWFRSDEASFIKQAMSVQNKEKDFEFAGNKYTQEYSLSKGFVSKKNGQVITEEEYRKAKYATPKIRRILEVQSDLFQKGRDNDFLVKGEIEYVDEGSPIELYPDERENQFLQLLNKDNNWVTFFVKSIIQDSAKKGYEKVLFPTGDTASKIEKHSTLEEFKKQKEGRIKELEHQKKDAERGRYRVDEFSSDYEPTGKSFVLPSKEAAESYGKANYNNYEIITEKAVDTDYVNHLSNEINILKKELERVEKEGFGALKPIYNFYENAVTNVLKKQYGKENVKQVTDEYGNTWNEITLDKVRDTAPIAFNKNSTESKQAKAVVVKMLDKLAKRFNVPYEIITAAKAKKLYDNYGGEKAFYYKGKVYLLEDGITLENALHEFSHPFIRAIAQKNVDLFTNIVEEILSTPEGRAIYNQVKELYPEHVVDGELNYAGFEEVAVRALTAEAEKQYTTPEFESAVQRLIKAIKNLLRGLFSTNAVDTIDANTSLKELAGILLGDKAYNLDLQDGTFAANKVKYQIYNGMPFTEESLERISGGEKRITVRTRNHPTGIYVYNNQRYKIINLGSKNINDFKTPERVKKKFREDYVEGKFKHIDNFFAGQVNMFVYQIEKIDNSIVNEYVQQDDIDPDLDSNLEFTDSESNAILTKIKDWLVDRRERVYKSKSDTGQLSKLNAISKIEELVKNATLAETIINIVEDTYTHLADKENPDSYFNRFSKLLTEAPEANTREKAEELLARVGAYMSYVKELDIIDEINNYIQEDEALKDSTLDKLHKIRDVKGFLQSKIDKVAPYLLAAANKGSITPELRKNIEAFMPMIEKLQKDIDSTEDPIKKSALRNKKEELERKLGFPLLNNLVSIYKTAGNDKSFFTRMITTIANTSDAAIGLFYQRYKEAYDAVIKRVNELTIKTAQEYKKFVEGKSTTNFATLYDSILEDVTVLNYNAESGQYETSKEKWFISEFDQNAYNLKKKTAYDLAALEEKKAYAASENGDMKGYKAGMAAARSIKAAFYKEYTISQDKLEGGREEVLETLKKKRKLFDNTAQGEKEFYIYVTKHLYSSSLSEEYTDRWEDPDLMAEYGKALLDGYVRDSGVKAVGMFMVPNKEMFPSAKWNALSAQDKAMHTYLLDVYLKSQELLPTFERPGLRIPSEEKDLKDIFIEEKDIKKTAKEAWDRKFNAHVEDAAKGIVFKGKKKSIPIYYNQPMAAELVNLNVVDTVLRFAKMAEEFKLNSSMESLALVTKETLGKRTVEKKTSTGKKILSALHKKVYGVDKVEETNFAETEAYKMFDSWINSTIYNERKFAATVDFMGRTIRVDKVVDSMLQANALTVLGADGLKAIANRLNAATNIGIEAVGSKYFSFKSLQQGKALVAQLMYATGAEENLLMDTLKGVKTSKFGQMLDIFQAIQGENDAVDEIGGSFVKRNASVSLLMGGLSAGEFISQANMFAAIAKSTIVKTKEGKEITLLEAYEKQADGIVRLREDVDFTLADEQQLRNRINAINKELHGVYNKLDEVEAKKTFIGRSLMQFRNFLVPNVERRWQGLHVNYEMNDVVEGYYRTLFRKIQQERSVNIWKLYNDPDLTENEKNNIRKALTELSIYGTLLAVTMILAGMGDDDDELKDSYGYNLAMYELLRLKSEIAFYIPLLGTGDALRIIKSPSSINTLLMRSAKVGNQLFSLNPLEEYQRDSGPNKKGDSKLKAKMLILLFGYNGSNMDPSIALENFKALTN